MKKDLVENMDYYIEEGKVVFTELYHAERGHCCGNKCKHCPYNPKWEKGNKNLEEKQ